jgi:hypothetical protein
MMKRADCDPPAFGKFACLIKMFGYVFQVLTAFLRIILKPDVTLDASIILKMFSVFC